MHDIENYPDLDLSVDNSWYHAQFHPMIVCCFNNIAQHLNETTDGCHAKVDTKLII